MHFFSDIPTFVLTEPDSGDRLQVVATRTTAGPAVSCYLSPLHAMITSVYFAGKGKDYEVCHAGSISPDVFVNADGKALIAEVRLGWPALDDGKIVFESEGNSATCSKVMIHSTPFGLPPVFELDPETLDQVERLHERAGMFAWRETYRDVFDWDLERMRWAVKRAVDSLKLSAADRMQCTHVALFDPEFLEWHHVPFEGL
jgi:hypothetical protein